MNDVLHSLAQDFSAHFMIKNIASEPIDAYLGPLSKVIGNEPTQDEVLRAFESKCEQLAKALEPCVETTLETKLVREIFRSAIRNYYGPSVDEQLT